jgi:5-methyltetrahydrofolate--homocysteine methyltransferase
MEILKKISEAIAECLELAKTKQLVKEALDAGTGALAIVNAISDGLSIVGDRYERGEYFLMELTIAGNTASEINAMIRPEYQQQNISRKGKVVIGTVLGDFHYIGKDIVIAMLESAGFEVIDLGVDVPTQRFLTAVQEQKPDILAMSGLLTIVTEEMKKVIDALRNAGLRESVKIMIGGRAVSHQYADEIGADAFGPNAVDAVKLASQWTGDT